jgi:hypothetical protein
LRGLIGPKTILVDGVRLGKRFAVQSTDEIAFCEVVELDDVTHGAVECRFTAGGTGRYDALCHIASLCDGGPV